MKEKIFGYYREAIIIREVEETFLRMFSEGKLNGTVHTCIGQELSAVSVCNNLSDKDFVVSNHRCHGHYIAFKKDIKGLIAELMGKKSGICGGIGSSQHIYNKNFLSNGIQGGIVPIAAGIAFSKKLKNENGIAVVFIGDGTLGEGAVYETMNIISLLELPILIVCENNLYAQSTYISENMSGSILNRAKSFNLNTFECETFDVEQLFSVTESAVDFVRIKRKPAFCLINTYRLSAHSKGDDNRDKEEILNYEKRDPVNIFKEKHKDEYTTYFNEAVQLINTVFKSIENDCNLNFVEYKDTNLTNNKIEWKNYNPSGGKYSDSIYTFLSNSLNNTENTVILGEDIHSPYGGAFKITRDLSDIFPSRVISTPISESAITGLSNGLAISGFRPILEIMFGDFITLALDQIINHASKFYHMYNKQINCPLIVRTPMGGRRGYMARLIPNLWRIYFTE